VLFFLQNRSSPDETWRKYYDKANKRRRALVVLMKAVSWEMPQNQSYNEREDKPGYVRKGGEGGGEYVAGGED